MIQTQIENVNAFIHDLNNKGLLEKRVLAVGIEMNQRYLEYLDELEIKVQNGVTVEVDGQTSHFENMDSFSAWLGEQL